MRVREAAGALRLDPPIVWADRLIDADDFAVIPDAVAYFGRRFTDTITDSPAAATPCSSSEPTTFFAALAYPDITAIDLLITDP